jgi:ABC-2 type transport system permease protein
MEQLIVTPLSTRDILLGKLLPFALIGVVDVFLVIGASRIIFGLEIAGSTATLLFFSLIFLLTTLGLGLLVSTFSHTQQQAMMSSVFFVMLPMIILSGFVFPVENMPAPIRAVTVFLPLRYYFTIVRGIYLRGAGLVELWREGLAMAVLGGAIFGASLLRFHKRLE